MSVDTSSETLRDQYLARIENLYSTVREWIQAANPGAKLTEELLQISEEPVEPYKAKVLVIERPGFKTVRLIPRGCWIIGAEGRVDMKSDLGTETLVYVSDGGPVVRIEMLTDGGKILPIDEKRLLGGAIAEGWVFLQNRQLGITPVLDQLLFQYLLDVLGR